MISAAAKVARLRTLFSRTCIYYRMYGTTATLRKIASYVVRRQIAAHNQPAEWWTFDGAMSGEIVMPHDATVLAPAGANTARSTLVQEIEIGFDSVSRIELLLATYNRRNTSRNRVALFTERGEELYYEEFSSLAVRDNEFHMLAVREPIDLKRSRRLYLVLGSPDGTKEDCITAWKNEYVPSQLCVVSGTFDDVRRGLTTSQPIAGAPLKGTLIYKIAGTRTAFGASYDVLPSSREFVARSSKTEVHILACVKGGTKIPRDLQKALERARSVEVTRTVSEAVENLHNGASNLLVVGALPLDAARQLLQVAHAAYVPSVFFFDGISAVSLQGNNGGSGNGETISARPSSEQIQLLRWSTFALCRSREDLAFASSCSKPALLLEDLMNHHQTASADTVSGWARIMSAFRRTHQPLVSIVTILYRKAAEIRPVLESYFNQTYEGPLEIVFIDDCSPDDSARIVEEWCAQRESGAWKRQPPAVRIIRNERNLGNCESRNIGIRHATGDIIVIVDADCMLNRDYIRRHVEAHAFGDCEIVIGPMNIETRGRDPLAMLEEYEDRPDLVAAHGNLQDPINKNSFLNSITRNFSIKSSVVAGELFDSLFSYSADPLSGFGWEDVEMGYRLYKQGARIKFVNEAFTIHVSPLIQDDDSSKPLRSMRNFRRLFEKHPELELVARRWAVDTYDRIRKWMDQTGASANEDRAFLDQRLGKYKPIRWNANRGRRYRVLTYRWHVPHQYELYKLPFDFTLVTGLGSPMTDTWEFRQRPMPANARLLPVEKVDPAEYDFAILHFDENVLAPENTNGVIGPEWGLAFKWFRERTSLPKIAICHGTPQFYGQYDMHYDKPDLMTVIEPERARLVKYLGDIPVVVNSYQAQREWQFNNSRVIWHGFDPTEFPPATYERGILSPLGPLVLSRPHYRGYFLYRKVFENFPGDLMPETLQVPEPHALYSGNAYALGIYRNYVDEIRRYSVYFNPTQRSPMPRARGEPMMCGVVTVNAHNHDVDMFIKNGINGFYSNDADELRDVLLHLMRNPDAVRRIGAEGRRTAMDVFNYDRYLTDWLALISDLLGETVQRVASRAERSYAASAG